jgi:gas vesicle protein GvpL/GvpF
VIYAYAICEPTVAAAALHHRGLGGARLRAVERGGLAAVYSCHRSLRPRPTPELLFAHERVVEAVMAHGVVMPMRFGTQLEREEELEAVLAARRDELLDSLERVRGKAELGIRLIPEGETLPTGPVEPSGRGYLLARAHADRLYQDAIREVHGTLAALSTASRVRQPQTPPAILAASYLVDSARVAEFRQRADLLAQRQAGIKVLVTGPWPPYSFASPANDED